MRKEGKMVTVSFKIPEEYLGLIDEVAEELERSRGDIIRRAIKYYLDEQAGIEIALEGLKKGKVYNEKEAFERVKELIKEKKKLMKAKGGLDGDKVSGKLSERSSAVSDKR